MYLSLVCYLLVLPVHSLSRQSIRKQIGAFIGASSVNDSLRDVPRRLNYYPDGEDFVCINGQNRYTRALYGGHSPFRLETSDRPVFAIYNNGLGGNISFSITLEDGKVIQLDETAFCESRYTAGKRTYQLKDPSWGKGEIHITALTLHDTDAAIWRFSASNMPKKSILRWKHGGATGKRLSRNGDLGVDPDDAFELKPDATDITTGDIQLTGESFFTWGEIPLDKDPATLFKQAEQARIEVASRIRIVTPDPFFNTIGGALAVAADGIWDGQVWLHGAVGWRMPLSGWRAAYTGDALGWHDRARTHFDAYAASQVTEVPNIISHPAQDPELNLARSIKEWGTPQYSNGYICRNPYRNDQMHHYDMNLCYMDELLWHLNWTGDLAYARKLWPVITRHLAWEKLNFDPNNDGLYDGYACIWASDALYYNSGAVTHSTAYNYRANKIAAEIAKKIGEVPTLYQNEAEKILKALNEQLWMNDRGHWAEFKDFMGHQRLHPNAGVWTIYHAIDSEVATPFQAYEATRYVDTEIPHIPVIAEGLEEEGYETISTTNWLPYSWSINNVAFAEVMHTALSYFLAGRPEEGTKLLKSSMLDGMYLGRSPGNFAQVSFYDAARGECYRDFGDPVGVASRAFIQGLFGILPDAMNKRLVIRPGYPASWPHATLQTPDVTYNFSQNQHTDRYSIQQNFNDLLTIELELRARKENIREITLNGEAIQWKLKESAVGYPMIVLTIPPLSESNIQINWTGENIQTDYKTSKEIYVPGERAEIHVPGKSIQLHDPQQVLSQKIVDWEKGLVFGEITGTTGHRTLFIQREKGKMRWWQPIHITIQEPAKNYPDPFIRVNATQCENINMSFSFNASVTDIFRNQYLTPRSPYTTLQIPTQGIGEWCHPKLTAEIDDSGLRAKIKDGVFSTPLGVSFRSPAEGNNIAFTSLWDNYPDKLTIPLHGKAERAYLLMAGSTNHMQCHMVNGTVTVTYTDGTSELLELINPENWCPIEQDFYVDNKAFKLNAPRPHRVHLKSGLVSNNLQKELNITGVYGREIEGGAGILLEMDLNPHKELASLTLETISNEIVIGLMGITLQRN